MSSAVQCPSCNQRVNVSPEMVGQYVMCPMCKSPLFLEAEPPSGSQPVDEYSPNQPQIQARATNHPLYPQPQPAEPNTFAWILGILGGGCLLTLVAVVLMGFVLGRAVRTNLEAIDQAVVASANSENLLEARADFETVILDKQSDNEPLPVPPQELFETVKFDSPLGEMSAYVSKPEDQNKKLPAIIWKFGGFGNGIGETAWQPQPRDNDQSASAFRKQGVVMMYPALRGGNDNPGYNECFFGEVDDIIAAAEYLAQQEFVDPDRIYLGGHSTGGTLVLLCAAATDKFRAVFAFGPVDDISGYGAEVLPFNASNRRELKLRNPVNWLQAINVPTFVIEGSNGNVYSLGVLQKKSRNDNLHFHVVRGTDHFGVLGPVNELLADKVVNDTGEKCNISLSKKELDDLFR